MDTQTKSVKILNPEVARKIAAGEVIDRPNAIIRELMDNAVDSGASKIDVEIFDGGIEKIRVVDNGSGMTKEDLQTCARPHATSKISTEEDLLKLSTLGFRGEALSSMAAVSRLEITSGGWKMNASVTEDHVLTPCALTGGTIVQTSRLFENFPARRVFLKRSSSEGIMCRSIFEEKALPRPDIEFNFSQDGEKKLSLPAGQTLTQRFVQTMEYFENEELFYELSASSPDSSWSFQLVLGEPSVNRTNRKNIFIYVNGRKIQEFSLMQAIEYGATGYFPNGTHPVACLFVQMDSSLVDFNIHPAKREARFKDIGPLHHAVSVTVKNFFKQYTVKNLVQQAAEENDKSQELFNCDEIKIENLTENSDEEISKVNSTAIPNFSNQTQTSKTEIFAEENKNKFSGSINYSTGGNQKYFVNHNAPRSESYADRRSSFISSFSNFANENNLNPEAVSEEANVEGRTTKPNYVQTHEELLDEENFHFVGSALGNFLVAEKDDVLYLIDQHAAHERMIYNELMEKAGEKQTLLIPYEIETSSPSEDAYIEEIRDKLEESGFTCKPNGNGKWIFTTVPVRWKGNEADLSKDLLEKRINPQDVLHATIASTACRSAVMDGTVLDRETAAEIAKGALKLEDPHCPHGRPVYTAITRRQLFELVKRI